MVMHAGTMRKAAWPLAGVALCALLLAACASAIVHEERSAYSHIRVIDRGEQRALYFLGDAEVDVVETLIDRREPHVLQHAYSRAAMAALLYRPEAERVLLIGLGGGAIVRFISHHFPRLQLDVVEIDPAVVRVAAQYFGTTESAGTRIHVADGRDYVERARVRYDLILIDAHLHPGAATDRTGHPLSLKGTAFLRSVADRLRPGGVAMFNVLGGSDSAAYLNGIRGAFAAVHLYRPQGSGNILAFASAHGALPEESELRTRAQAFDRRGGYGFSFESLLGARSR